MGAGPAATPGGSAPLPSGWADIAALVYRGDVRRGARNHEERCLAVGTRVTVLSLGARRRTASEADVLKVGAGVATVALTASQKRCLCSLSRAIYTIISRAAKNRNHLAGKVQQRRRSALVAVSAEYP
jgi:hypothetical protein